MTTASSNDRRKSRVERFMRGDCPDWPELYMRGEIDDLTLYEKTGLNPGDLVTIVVPRVHANALLEQEGH